MLVTGQVYPELDAVYPAKYPRRGPRIALPQPRRRNLCRNSATESQAAVNRSRHVSRGCAFGDFDNDGDLDVVIMNQNEPPSLLRNDAPAGNHWIKIRLDGTKSNRSAIGARVVVRYGGSLQVQEVMSQSSYVSANDPRLHFGLGSAESVDIEVHWPLGLVELHKSVPVNRLITLKEGSGTIDSQPLVAASPLIRRS